MRDLYNHVTPEDRFFLILWYSFLFILKWEFYFVEFDLLISRSFSLRGILDFSLFLTFLFSSRNVLPLF